MQNAIRSIISYHGLTISHEAPNVQKAALYGELVYTLGMMATRDPDGWVDQVNAAGDIEYQYGGGQPYNNQDKQSYMEIRGLDHYKFFLGGNGGLLNYNDYAGSCHFLKAYIGSMGCPSFNRNDNSDVMLNRAIICAFKHFDIKRAHINYQDPYICHLLQKGILLKTLSWLSVYYKHDMSCIDRISEDDNFTKFGVAVMFSECINDLEVNLTPLGMPEYYRERIDNEDCALIIDGRDRLVLVTTKRTEGLYGIPTVVIDEAIASVGKTHLVRHWGDNLHMYLRLNQQYTGTEYPEAEQNDIYLLSIVERGFLNKAFNIYAERSGVMTWRDLSSLVETYDETDFVECQE